MTIRATAKDVEQNVPDVPAGTNMSSYVRRASVLVDKISTEDSDSELSSDMLREIEILLTCHYYCMFDPQYTSRSTGGASGSFVQRDYWKEACNYDVTGYLKRISADRKQKATCDWMGKRQANQTTYQDRNV